VDSPFLNLPVEHDTTETYSHASEDVQDRHGNVTNDDHEDLDRNGLDESQHDFLSIGFHYALCIFCDFLRKKNY
jgi:hypothetical protein